LCHGLITKQIKTMAKIKVNTSAPKAGLTGEEQLAFFILSSASQISIDALNELDGFFLKFPEFPAMRGAAKSFVSQAKKVEAKIYKAIHTPIADQTLTPEQIDAMERAYYAYSNAMEYLIKAITTSTPEDLRGLESQVKNYKEASEISDAVISELRDNLTYFEQKLEVGKAFRLKALLSRIEELENQKI